MELPPQEWYQVGYQGPGVLPYQPKYDPFRGRPREYVWTDDAACEFSDPDLFQMGQAGDVGYEGFHPQQVRDFNVAKYEQAKLICDDCPVKAKCLSEAGASDLYWSVRGGRPPGRLSKTNGAAPGFPTKEYFPWACVRCNSAKYNLRKNGVKFCPTCNNGRG